MGTVPRFDIFAWTFVHACDVSPLTTGGQGRIEPTRKAEVRRKNVPR